MTKWLFQPVVKEPGTFWEWAKDRHWLIKIANDVLIKIANDVLLNIANDVLVNKYKRRAHQRKVSPGLIRLFSISSGQILPSNKFRSDFGVG